MTRFARNLAAEIPGYDVCSRKLRAGEVRATTRTLMIAATLCLLRAATMPWVLRYTGPDDGGQSDLHIVATSLLLMSAFALGAMWSRFSPVGAVLFSAAAFAGVCVHDAMQSSDLLAQGIVGKTIIGIVLLRATMNAILSRTV